MKLILGSIKLVLVLGLFAGFTNSFAQSHFNSGLAVVLIDMQKGFYERGGVTRTEGLQRLVTNQQNLLRWARGNLIPVLVLEYSGFGATDPRLMEIIHKGRHRIITKNTDNGFIGISKVEAIETLKSWNVDSIIVAGINGGACVKRTILGALENGFNVMTTHYVIGNLNRNPPVYPNGKWYHKGMTVTVFPTLDSIIRPAY